MTPTGYLAHKFTNPSIDTSTGNWGYLDFPVFRYAEITSLMTNLGYKAPATGDTGVVLYVGLAVLALTGGVFVARRKELF